MQSLDLQISSLAGYFMETNAFLVYAICFHETVHNKINGVHIKVFWKLKMAQNVVLLNRGETSNK